MLNEIIKTALIGGLIHLDSAAVAQIMVSQPVVAGSVIGWFLSDFKSGLFVSVLIQLVWVGMLPIGSYQPPEWTINAVTASAVYILLKRCLPTEVEPIILYFSIVIGVINGYLGRALTVTLRKFHNRFINLAEKTAAKTGKLTYIEFINWLAVILIWATASSLILFGTYLPIIFGKAFFRLVAIHMHIHYQTLIFFHRLISATLISLGLAVVLDLFQIEKRWSIFTFSWLAGAIIAALQMK